jgi:hypothetical protein
MLSKGQNEFMDDQVAMNIKLIKTDMDYLWPWSNPGNARISPWTCRTR